MVLSENDLNSYLKSRNIKISKDFSNDLLEQFGKPFLDDNDHITEFSEQDISEQLRKSIQNYIEGGIKRE